MSLKILLLEDDHIQRADIKRAIETEEGIDAKVSSKSTEFEFNRDFDAIAADPPQIAVLDIMVRWANPAPNMQPAPEEVTLHPELAGLRCASLLRNDERTRHVKVILYSVLGKDDVGGEVPEGADCLVKELDFQNLIERLKEVIASNTPNKPPQQT